MMSKQPRKLQWIIWGMSLILCVSTSRTILDLLKRQDIVKIRQAELQRIKMENKILEQSLSDMTSPSYIERIARDKLGLIREGESVVIIGSLEASESGVKQDRTAQIWRQWFELFF